MFYVYIVKSAKDNKLYLGYTNNLQKRIKEHNSKYSQSTKSRIPFKPVYYEVYASKGDALKRERNLKLGARALRQLKLRVKKSLAS